MKQITRNGEIITCNAGQNKLLNKLYGTKPGRLFLSLLIKPSVSKLGGAVLNSRISALAIDPFIKNNHINMKEYIPKKYISYNDFFTRRIKPSYRQIDNISTHLISPSDGKVSIYKIDEHSIFNIKNTQYTTESILKSKFLADEYRNGYFVIIRLCVDDYHHYCNVDNGTITSTRIINGVFHTVNPIANDYYKIYKENTREYSIIETENFGKIIQMEVGALMVGKIVNIQHAGYIEKGSEKGKFEFGGSTIVLMLKESEFKPDNDILINTSAGYETIIKMGEKIGESIEKH